MGHPHLPVLAGEIAYVGMICLNLFLYLALATLSFSFINCAGKFSPVQLAAYRNQFLLGVFKGLGLDRASLNQLRMATYVILGLMLVGYAWAVYIFRRRPEKRLWVIMSVAAGASTILLLAPPLFSRDIFSNIYYGKIITHYRANPYEASPQMFLNDPAFTTISVCWKNTPMVYGPFFALFSAALARISGEGLISSIYVNKGAMAAFHLGSALVIWRFLGRYYPRRRLVGTVAYAWNPLVLIHSVGGGHNDVMMAFFAVLALHLAMAGHERMAVFSLTLSALTKYTTAIPLTILLFYLVRKRGRWQDRLKEAAVCLLIVLLTVVALFAPFWEGPKTLRTVVEGLKMSTPGSPGALLSRFIGFLLSFVLRVPADLAQKWGEKSARALLGVIFLAVFSLLALRCRSREDLLDSWALSLTALLATTSYLYPWYMIWIIPLICMRAWNRRTRLLLFCTLYIFFNNDLDP